MIRSFRTYLVVIISVILAIVSGCGGKKEVAIPDDIYQPDSMVKVMTELHLAEAILQQYGYQPDQIQYKTTYIQRLIASQGIDTARFNRSFDFYSAQPAVFMGIYDEVIVEISKRQAATKAGK